MNRKYYEAYDDRYRQIHNQVLQWFHDTPSPVVMEVIREYGISRKNRILELGCGEGRDAFPLLNEGFRLLATDISQEAIRYCKERAPSHAGCFSVLDCVAGNLEENFDFIFAVSVVHMLVLDEDRAAFYHFIREHLEPNGIALICTMGDGVTERQTDIHKAFELQDRIHEQTGKKVRIAGTTCRMVCFDTFRKELDRNGLDVLRLGTTVIEPDFPQTMYAVVRRA